MSASLPRNGRISVAEYEQIENYVNANRTSDALLLRRAQALCERPLRGKVFTAPQGKGTK